MSDWIRQENRKPADGEFVLAAAPSGSAVADYRLTEARYDAETDQWVNAAGDSVTDGGLDVTHWQPFVDPKQPIPEDEAVRVLRDVYHSVSVPPADGDILDQRLRAMYVAITLDKVPYLHGEPETP